MQVSWPCVEDRITEAQKMKFVCTELSSFAKLTVGSFDKLLDEYIALFTVYVDRDEPHNRQLYTHSTS